MARLLKHLEEVILDHVANGARRVVESAAALDAEVFGHRDLHALDVSPIPERLQDRIREASEQHVVNRPLAEVMVDPEDVLFDERAEQDPVQLARRRKVLAEGLLDDDAGPFRTSGLRQLLHDGPEERRRDRQVVRGLLGAAERLPERREGRRIFVVPVDVAKQARQLVERVTVQPAVLLDAVLRARAQLVERPAGLGHADDRHVEVAALGHRLQRGKDLLERQIARRAEEHERVGMCVGHRYPVLSDRCHGSSRGLEDHDDPKIIASLRSFALRIHRDVSAVFAFR